MKAVRLPHVYRPLNLLVVASLLAAMLPSAPVANRSVSAAGEMVLPAASAPATFPQPPDLKTAEVAAAPAPAAPAVLAQPLAVSRVQSAYSPADAISGALVVTFTVTNNRPPAAIPHIPISATLTETMNIAAALDFGNDPNTLYDVLLVDTLSGVGSYLDASPLPDRSADVLAWNLGKIPPLGSASVALTLQVPGSVAGSSALDGGAVAWGVLQGRQVSAQAYPAMLAPDTIEGEPIGDWLIWTVDADTYDQDMLAQAAQLGQDPLRLFEYARLLGYESYRGSLRGTRGTLWSRAGNSLDQASLLIAMLRASGVPARYRHGTLPTALVHQLILSMFPSPLGVAGHIPAGTAVSDPVSDPRLLAETADHWWVEAYLPGLGWVDLDPTFVDAAVGERFVADGDMAADGTDRIREVPDALRHKVTLTVTVEQYHPLNIGGSAPGMRESVPLARTFSTVELAGKPVTLGHLVNTVRQPGLIFVYTQHTYTPYFRVGDENEVITDGSFEDLITNFPLGTHITVAEFLSFQVRDPDGQVRTYRREVVDLLGFEVRQGGGTVYGQFGGDNAALFTTLDLYTTWFWPGQVPTEAAEAANGQMLATVEQLNADSELLAELEGLFSPSADQLATMQQVRMRFQTNLGRFLSTIGLVFGSQADQAMEEMGEGMLVKAYYAAPRIVTIASEAGDEAVEFNVDLRHTLARTIPYPGQAITASYGLNMGKGFIESSLEGDILQRAFDKPAATTARVFEAAADQGIESRWINQYRLPDLEALNLSAEAKARIIDVVYQGKVVLVPQEPVLLDGQLAIGWWEMDPETGETIGVMENGLHNALMEWLLDMSFWSMAGPIFGFMQGFTAYTLSFVASVVELINTGGDMKTAFDRAQSMFDEISAAGTALSCIFFWAGIGNTVDCMLGQFGADVFTAGGSVARSFFEQRVQFDPPLPDALLAYPQRDPAQPVASARVTPHTLYPIGTLVASLETGLTTISGTLQGAWTSSPGSHVLAGSLTASSVALYDGVGLLIGSGAVQATPRQGDALLALLTGGPVQATLAGSGRTGLHAPALAGLASGGDWTEYTVELTADTGYTLTLQNATVRFNGNPLPAGPVQLVTSAATLSGSGPTAAPNLTAQLAAALQDANLQIGPATGSAQIGSTPIPLSNGLAILNYAGGLNVTESTPSVDAVVLDGPATFFALVVDPPATITDPNTPVAFDALISTNLDQPFTVTVTAPEGWQVAVDATGAVAATPPTGTPPQDHAILVTARLTSAPSVYASAVHTVTTTSFEGMALRVIPDPLVTVPWGPAASGSRPGSTNDGRIQLPDSAYSVRISNTSTVSRTFSLAVTGLPAGWLLFNGSAADQTTVHLPPGAVGQVGLYISPTLSTLPPAGTLYPFSVSAAAAENPALQDTDSATYTVPGVAFNYLQIGPELIWAGPNSTATLSITLTNVGNIAGSFDLTLAMPGPSWVPLSPLASPVGLDPAESYSQSVPFAIPDVPIGQHNTVAVESPAPGTPYIQRDALDVLILSAHTLPIYQTSARLAGECALAGGVVLPGALSYLGSAVHDLDVSCHEGPCALDLRDRVVSAARAVANHAEPTSGLITADDSLAAIAAAMAMHASDADLLADLGLLGDAVRLLEFQACALAHHDIEVSFNPATAVILEGTAATLALRLRNAGSLATTAAVTLTPPTGGSTSWLAQSVPLAPAEVVTVTTVITPTGQGIWLTQAEVAAVESSVVRHQAAASVSVVDALLRIADVIVVPTFVEVGDEVNATFYADVANVVNLPLAGEARVQVSAPDGSVVASISSPLTVPSSLVPVRLQVGAINTSGLVTGSYTVTVRIVDAGGNVIPKATGSGMLAVGQALEAGHAVAPLLVAPGTVTVTNFITTSLSQAILEQLGAGSRGLVSAGTIWLPQSDDAAGSCLDCMSYAAPTASTQSSDVSVRLPDEDEAAVQFVFTDQPTQTIAGIAFPLAVTALDALGEVALGYTGTVAFGSSDPQATLPVSHTFTTGPDADNGLHTFAGLTLRTAGVQWVKLTDVDQPSISGTITVSVEPAAIAVSAGRFSASSPHPADGIQASTVVVTVTDSFGNPVRDATVWVVATGSENSIAGSPGATDADGGITATLTSTQPEAKQLRVLIGDGQAMSWIPGVAMVEFTGATIIGVVFDDPNRNGAKEPAEPGLGSVQVSLFLAGDTLPLRMTVTDSDGGYSFTALAAGTYRIEQTRLDQYAFTNAGVLTATVADFDASTGHDFGNYAVGHVRGTVWTDEDQDGERGPGEDPIPGVLVNAYDSENAMVGSMLTGDAGAYHLELAASLPHAPENFVFNSGRLSLQEPASAVVGNGDLSRELTPLDPSTYPANFDFSSGAMDGWTGSGGAVTVVSNTYNLDGPYLLINAYNQYVDSPAFTVPPEAQSLRFSFFSWCWESSTERPITVYARTGPSFDASTLIGTVNGSALQGWRTGVLDLQAWQGRAIQLRFVSDTNSYWSGRSRIDSISLNVEAPDWTMSDTLYVRAVNDNHSLPGGGAYVRLDRYNQWADTAAFLVPSKAQSVRFDYATWSTRDSSASRPLNVYALSGDHFGTAQSLGSAYGSNLEGWKTAALDLQGFSGQVIKLRFQTEDNDYWGARARVDNVGLYIETPGWKPSDSLYVRIGADQVPPDPGTSAPENPDFELGLSPLDASVYPLNHDFAVGLTTLPTSTYPANYDFSSESLSGWSVSDPAQVQVISDAYDLDGGYLRLNSYNQSATSPAFAVPDDAQSLRLNYYVWNARVAERQTSRPINVDVLSGPDFSISTQIGELWGNWFQGWQIAVMDLQPFQGQTIKLRIRTENNSYWGTRARIDNLSLHVEAPNWRTSSSAHVRVVHDPYGLPDSGAHLLLNRYGQWADSTPIDLPPDVQSLRFDYMSYAGRQTDYSYPFHVYVVSGPNLDTVTLVGSLSGSRLEGWKQARVGLQSYAGQTVRLRFQTDGSDYWDGRARIDNISLNCEVPGWSADSGTDIWVTGDQPPQDPLTGFDNGDFALGLTPFDPATYPANYGFTQMRMPLDPATYPSNYDFGLGDLGEWTVSNNTYVAVISDTTNLDGYHLRINQYGQSATSPSFYVPTSTQSLRFDCYVWNTRDNTTQRPLYVYALTGPNLEITTQVGEIWGAANNGWFKCALDLQPYQGRTIKLHFSPENSSYWGTRSRIDNISLNHDLPGGWRPSDVGYDRVQIISDTKNLDGPYLRLDRYGVYADTPLFTVPDDAQSVRFNYYNWTDRDPSQAGPLHLYVRSGSDLSILTHIATVNGSGNDGWKIARASIQRFRGEAIRLRFQTDGSDYWNYRSRVDRISLNIEVPQWNLSDGSLISVGSIDGISGNYLLLNRYGAWASPPPFLVPTSIDSLQFDYWNWTDRSASQASPLHVYADGGDGFSVPVLLGTVYGSANSGWQSANINLTSVRGRLIRLRLQTDGSDYWNYRSRVDNIRLVDGAGGSPVATDWAESAYVRLNRYGATITSVPFLVPANAMALEFDYLNWSTRDGTTSRPLEVIVLSGAGFDVSNLVGTVNGSFLNGWRHASLSLAGYRDQVIRLRFRTDPNDYWNGRSKIDAVVITLDPEAGSGAPPDAYADGTYLHLMQYGASAVSAPLAVPTDTASLHLEYLIYNTRSIGENRPLTVYALSGPDYTTSTSLGVLWGNWLQGWREANLAMSSFRGQTIKLRFLADTNDYWNGRARIDNVYLLPMATTPYTITEINPVGYTSSTADTVPVDVFGGGQFTVGFGDFLLDRYASTVQVSPGHLVADGLHTAAVTVTLKDGQGNPLPDYGVEILAAGTRVSLDQPADLTNANGQAFGGIRSTFAPQVALVTARTISDNVTLAATVPITFTPGPADAARSGLIATPASVVADGIEASRYTVTLRDRFDNLVAGNQVTVTVSSAYPVTLTQPLSLTNLAGQITGTVRSTHEQMVTLRALDLTDLITLTQSAEVNFSLVDPGRSLVEAAPHTLIADGVSTSTITVTLINRLVGPLPGKSVLITANCAACSLGGGRAVGPVEIGPTGADGTATATLYSTAVEVVTVSAVGDGIPLADTAQITFTVGPVNPDASTLTGSPTTVVADGVSLATLVATLYDSYGHRVPGKTVQIRATGDGLTLNQPSAVTDAQGQVQATLRSTVVQPVTVSAVDQSDGITLTQTVEIQFVTGPAAAVQSTLIVSPTTVLADGFQTTTITVTLRDSLGHPAAYRSVQLVVTGQDNRITPAAQGITNADGAINWRLASTAVGAKSVAVRDLAYDVTLPVGEVQFVAGPVDPDLSTLTTNKSTVLVGSDQATLTATLWDNLGHRIPGKQVVILASGVGVTVTQPVTVTDSLGRVQATVRSNIVQQATVRAVDLTDNLTLTQVVALTFVAGPASPTQSTITVSPTTVVADNVHTAAINANLRDAQGNPLVQRAVRLVVTGQNNVILPTSQQNTDAEGRVAFTLASSKAEVKQLSLQDLLGGVTLPAGEVTFIPGDLSASRSTVTASPTKAAANGISTILITVRALDALGNPISGLPVVISASGVPVTLTQPTAEGTDADGIARGALVGSQVGSATVRATVSGVVLDQAPVVQLEPLYRYQASVDPAVQSVPVGGLASFDLEVTNLGYLPDGYALSLAEPYPAWFNLEPALLSLAPGQQGHATLLAQTSECLDAGSYPFFLRVASAGVGNVTTLTGTLTVTPDPVLLGLSPADASSIGGTNALFSWATAVSATTSLYIKPVTGTVYSEYVGPTGYQHRVAVSNLERNTDYHWYARSESICGVAQSSPRTLSVLNGVVFGSRAYTFDIERDYDQQRTVSVHNQDSVPHTVLVTLENPHPELIIAFIGEGSIDEPFLLQPGGTQVIRLAIHAQDANQTYYPLIARLTADDGEGRLIQDAVPVHLNVHIPDFRFSIQQTGFDPQTLVTSYRVTNLADPLTDLAITAEVTGTGSIYLLPAMAHGYLRTGESFSFQAYPALDSGFQSLSGSVIASAGGVVTNALISLSLPAGTSMFLGTATDVSLESKTADWYCTNRPLIYPKLVLPPGFRRAEVTKAQFLFHINSYWSSVRPHDVHLYLNDHEIGALLDMIPHGLYTFPVQPDWLNESLIGPSVNNLKLETLHMNGGHYVVASDMILFLCLSRYQEWVAATSQAEADQIVSSRSFLIPAPTTLEVNILTPAEGQTLVAGLPVTVRVDVNSDLTQPIFFEVTAEADNGNGSLILYDDGTHDDGAYRDGVYANSWVPTNPGATTLSVHAGSCTIAGDASVSVTVQSLSYAVDVSHRIPTGGVDLLSGSVTPPPDQLLTGPDEIVISWTHTLTPAHTLQRDQLSLVVRDLQPGEVRQVASGTVISYTGPGGSGVLNLPPLTVSAGHLVAVAPPLQTANLGGRAFYQVSLFNPGTQPITLDLTTAGLPESWVNLTPAVALAGGQETVVPLTLTLPLDANLGDTPFSVIVETSSGGRDQAGAVLRIADLLDVAITPVLQLADPGEIVIYSVTVTNLEPTAQTASLAVQGLEGNQVTLPETIALGANESATVLLQVTAYAPQGAHVFVVTASVPGTGSSRQTAAILQIRQEQRVTAHLSPAIGVGGPGTSVPYTLTVTNGGTVFDSYSLALDVPAGWSYLIHANNRPVSTVALPPYIGNQAVLQLLVTPATDAVPGNYPVRALVLSDDNPSARATAEVMLEVTDYGVQIEVTPVATVLDPTEVGVWQVTLTNTGEQPDTYDLTAGGILAQSGQFSTNPISLAPDQSQVLQLSAADLDFALPHTYGFEVRAQSRFDERIWGHDTGEVTFTGIRRADLVWLPAEQVITDTLTAVYLLLITNTGNVESVYQLAVAGADIVADLQVTALPLPPKSGAAVRVVVEAAGQGIWPLTATASVSGEVFASEPSTLTVVAVSHPPTVYAGPDQVADEGSPITFTGVITDEANLGPYAVQWDLGDSTFASGTLTPTHVYPDDGIYTVVLTVTNSQAQSASDSLTVTVRNVAPTVNAGPNVETMAGNPVPFAGSFTDPGALDTHTIHWAFGDGASAHGTLTPTHTYLVVGTFTATLTVTDDDAGVGSDTSRVTVHAPAVSADLAVTKVVTGPIRQPSGEPLTFREGQTILFTVQVLNNGPDPASAIVLEDLLPTEVLYLEDDGGGSYDPQTGLWQVGGLAPGAQATLRIWAVVRANTAGSRVENVARIHSAGQHDPNLTNNQASVAFDALGWLRLYMPVLLNQAGG